MRDHALSFPRLDTRLSTQSLAGRALRYRGELMVDLPNPPGVCLVTFPRVALIAALVDACRDQGVQVTFGVDAALLSESDLAGYFGGILDFAMIQNRNLYSFDSLKQAVLTNRARVYGGEELFKSHEEQAALARSFTHFMHGHSIAPALAWPETVDLTNHRVMLDVGGGSGAHAIGAIRKWPDLRAIVFDLPPVCEVANEYIRRYNLQTRIGTHPGDIWTEGQQFSGRELSTMLSEAGFTAIEVKSTFGYCSIVTGQKPS